MKGFSAAVFMVGLVALVSASALGQVNPQATMSPTLDGRPLAGPANSDCQVYIYSGGTSAINCPMAFTPVSGDHAVGGNDWGTTLVASGGGMVVFTLPSVGGSAGRNSVGFTTDGKTGFTISVKPPGVMQGSSFIQDGVITVAPNSSGWVSYVGNNLYQVSMQ